jgi:hypothetical protein
MPVFTKALSWRDSTSVEVAGSRIFLALYAYHARFHAYPGTLDDLKTRLGWQLPEDPFSGNPFIYKQKDHGFLLYSIGPNLKDDGGHPRNRTIGPHEDDNYDIVWTAEK